MNDMESVSFVCRMNNDHEPRKSKSKPKGRTGRNTYKTLTLRAASHSRRLFRSLHVNLNGIYLTLSMNSACWLELDSSATPLVSMDELDVSISRAPRTEKLPVELLIFSVPSPAPKNSLTRVSAETPGPREGPYLGKAKYDNCHVLHEHMNQYSVIDLLFTHCL